MNNDDNSSMYSLSPLTSGVLGFYAKQAHLIDTAQHDAWAQTFVPEGEFHSPSYPEPAIGHNALSDISQAFAAAASEIGEIQRHVVVNVWIVESDRSSARVRAYVLIMGSNCDAGITRVVRVVTQNDHLVFDGQQWLVRHRQISYETNAESD